MRLFAGAGTAGERLAEEAALKRVRASRCNSRCRIAGRGICFSLFVGAMDWRRIVIVASGAIMVRVPRVPPSEGVANHTDPLSCIGHERAPFKAPKRASGLLPGEALTSKRPQYSRTPAVRNDREDRGNVGIIRSPLRASILPDCGGALSNKRPYRE